MFTTYILSYTTHKNVPYHDFNNQYGVYKFVCLHYNAFFIFFLFFFRDFFPPRTCQRRSQNVSRPDCTFLKQDINPRKVECLVRICKFSLLLAASAWLLVQSSLLINTRSQISKGKRAARRLFPS